MEVADAELQAAMEASVKFADRSMRNAAARYQAMKNLAANDGEEERWEESARTPWRAEKTLGWRKYLCSLSRAPCSPPPCPGSGHSPAQLVLGKSRVTPLKMQTLSRLELAAAVAGARLVGQCARQLEMPVARVTMWSDSMIVLGYIANRRRRFKTFVA